MMKIGIKCGYNKEIDKILIEDMLPYIDFLEYSAIDNSVLDFYRDLNQEFIIHAGHRTSMGVNIVNPHSYDKNIVGIRQSIDAADFLGAKKIVIHPEVRDHEDCSIDVFKDFIKKNYDSRFIIENMPCPGFYCVEPDEITEIMYDLEIGFCLDFDHAVCYAFSKGYNIREYVNELVSLQPSHYHLSDTKLKLNISSLYLSEEPWCDDLHLPLKKGDLDLEMLLSLIPDDSTVTLETTPIKKSLINDIKIIQEIMSY